MLTDCCCREPATLLARLGLSFAQPHSRMEIIRKDAENCVESLPLFQPYTALQGSQAYGYCHTAGYARAE